eukprot:8663518-Pyramimonas_sp.AAC.1
MKWGPARGNVANTGTILGPRERLAYGPGALLGQIEWCPACWSVLHTGKILSSRKWGPARGNVLHTSTISGPFTWGPACGNVLHTRAIWGPL